MTQSVRILGFRAALIAASGGIAFTVTGLLALAGLPRSPWDPVIPDGASFVMALAFVVLMACIHEAAPPSERIWSLVALAISILYAAMVSIVYMTVITFVTPALERGSQLQVAPFVFDLNGSFMQAVDGVGYFFQCLATLFAAPVFAALGHSWIRRAFVANGIAGFFVLLAYMPLVIPAPLYQVIMPLGGLWIVTYPAATLLAASYFRSEQTRVTAPTVAAVATAPVSA